MATERRHDEFINPDSHSSLAEQELLALLRPAGLLRLGRLLVYDDGALILLLLVLLRVLLPFLSLVGVDDDITSAAAPDVRGAMALTTSHPKPMMSVSLITVPPRGGSVCLRLDVLEGARLGGVRVLGHVAGASPAGGHHRPLEGGRLEVLRLDLGRLCALDDIARATAPRRLEVRHLVGV